MTAVKSEVSNSTGGTPVPRVIIQTIDQCECTGCESVIPHQNIVAKIDKKTGVRTVRAYCEHCNIGFLINQVLRDGAWKIVGMVAVLDHREKARLLRETDEVRRQIQTQTAKERREAERLDSAFDRRVEEDATAPGPDYAE
jgi:Pyruvate/2-oxoacid:ferredoxin oxidoreductase delta subunit